jgi:serine/threonine protein kinase
VEPRNARNATRAALPNIGDVVAHKYGVEQLLGMGGMSAVFAVRHVFTGRRFAIKWLLPEFCADAEFVQRFMREARIGGSIEHPNIVEVFDVSQEQDSLFMVMEFLEGESLAECITRERQLAPAQAFAILLPCMRGLAAAHAAGIVHRDLKPENIFLARCADGSGMQPKLLDFGISKVARGWAKFDASLTQTGTTLGTASYMPLEQMLGKAIDQRADIYALGVVLYELLSGQLPYTANTFAELAVQVASDTPRPLERLLPSAPQALCAVVQRAMARNPDQRFARIVNMMDALVPFTQLPDMQRVLPVAIAFADTHLAAARGRVASPLHAPTEPGRGGRPGRSNSP